MYTEKVRVTQQRRGGENIKKQLSARTFQAHKHEANTKAPLGISIGMPAILYAAMYFTVPVVILKRLVPKQQVSEAVARRKRRHLRIHLRHLEG